MKTPAPAEASLRLVDATASAGRGTSLQAGAFVSVSVRERIGPDLYRIAIGPRLLTASSATPLEPGRVLKARVERSGDALILRLRPAEARGAGDPRVSRDPREALASALSAASLPNDPASRVAVAALLREGMALEARALVRVRRAALRDGGEGGDASSLAAAMEAKGVPAEGGLLGELLTALAGSWGGAGDPNEGGGEGGRDEEPGGAGSASVPESELPRVLGSLLRDLAMRVGGDSRGCGSTLALFNHLRGPEGGCVLVPFRFALDAVDFTGSFRIQLPYVRGGQGRFEARFSASIGDASDDWSFSLSFGAGASILSIRMPEGRARLEGEGLGELAAELAPLSCSLRFPSGDDRPEDRAEGFDADA